MKKALQKSFVLVVEAVVRLLVKHIKQKRKFRQRTGAVCPKS